MCNKTIIGSCFNTFNPGLALLVQAGRCIIQIFDMQVLEQVLFSLEPAPHCCAVWVIKENADIDKCWVSLPRFSCDV